MTRTWVVALALMAAPAVRADGAFFSKVADRLSGPDQKAIVCWDGTRETLLLASKVKGERVEDVMQAAWVVPLPGSEKPKVGPGKLDAFVSLIGYFEEKGGWTEDDEAQAGIPGGAISPAVRELERFAVDMFDVAVLDATDADALLAWLGKNGYRVPAAAKGVLADCIAGGTRYFVANRIDFSSKGNVADARVALEQLDRSRPARTALEDLRRDVIAAVLAGKSFDESPGQALKLLDRAKYDALVAKCKVGPDALAKLALFSDHWMDFLMGDHAATDPMRPFPDDLEVVVSGGRGGLTASEKKLELGVRQYALDRSGVKLDDLRGFMSKSFLGIARKYAQVRESLDLKLFQLCLSLEQDLGNLANGAATPLRIEFTPKQAMYPLRISAINPGATRVEVYVCAPDAVEDASGTLAVSASKPLPARLAARLKPGLDVGGAKVVTRFAYQGAAAAFAKDAIFAPASSAVTRPELAPEDRAIESRLEKPEDLVAFAEKNPKSRYADDATVLAVVRLDRARRPEKALLDRVRALVRALPEGGVQLEPWTLLEAPALHRAEYYRTRNLLSELLVATLAHAYRLAGDGEVAADLAQGVLSALDKAPADSVPVRKLKSELEHLAKAPDNDKQSDAITAAALALANGDGAQAAALVEPLTKKPAAAGPSGGVFANLHPMTPWFILGAAEAMQHRLEPARVAYEKAIELGPELHMGMVMAGDKIINVSVHVARQQLCACYLRLDRVDEGLKYGEQALQGLREHLPGDTRSIALAEYNVACAYGRKSDAAKVVAHLKEAIALDGRYKATAAEDTDFKSIAGDASFQALLK